MNHPYNKYDYMLGRDLTNAERLQPAISTLNMAKKLIEQFEHDIQKASEKLTENQLEIICRAANVAQLAAENAAFLGCSRFNPHTLETVKWEDE